MATVAEHPSPHRRHGSGPAFLGPAYQTRGTGSAVPLRINFNSTRTPRAPPSRRRSADYWTARHSPLEPGMPLQWRSVSSARTSRPPPRATGEVWDLGLQRIKTREDKRVPLFAGGEAQVVPPTIVEEHVAESGGLPTAGLSLTSTSASADAYPSPRATPESSSPETPAWKAHRMLDSTSPLEGRSRRIDSHSPLESEAQRMDSPLQDAFEPLPMQRLPPKPARPTGKRRRVPSARVAIDTEPQIGRTNVKYKHNDEYILSPISSADVTPHNEFQIPRKPPPIPKASIAPKPAPLKLFPTTSTSTTTSILSPSTASGSAISPPSSLRSASSLDNEPATPTTATSSAYAPLPGVPATKQFTDFGSLALTPTGCSPVHTTTSGWYDDDDEGNERYGLMGSRGSGRSFAGLKSMWRGCFGCS